MDIGRRAVLCKTQELLTRKKHCICESLTGRTRASRSCPHVVKKRFEGFTTNYAAVSTLPCAEGKGRNARANGSGN